MQSKAEFDRYADGYDELLRDPFRDGFSESGEFFHRRKGILIADFFRRHALNPKSMDWLDVGCGKAKLLGCEQTKFRSAAGCDPSVGMIRDASGINVRLQTHPSLLPFPANCFDFVTAVCVYHHVEETYRVPLTREIARVLRPNGIFCMIEHNPYNPFTQLIVRRARVDADARLLSSRRARAYSAQCGLRFVESEYFLYLPEKLYDDAAWLESMLRLLPMGGQYATFTRK